MDDEFDRCRWCHRAVAIDEDFCSDDCEDEYDAEWADLASAGEPIAETGI